MLNLKSLTVAAMLTLSSFGALAPAASASDYRDFAISNRNRGASIVSVWYSRAGTSDPWRRVDLSSPVYPGTRSWFNVNTPRGDNVYDFKVQFNDGYVAEARYVDLSRVSVINAD